MGRLDGKIALVTGGSSGIGLASALRFAAEGAEVYITGRRQAELDKAVALIESEVPGCKAKGVQGDVAIMADLDRLYAEIAENSGRLDILFANAGFGERATIFDITEEHFDRVVGANMKGCLFSVQKALPLMGNGGSIILTASITAYKAYDHYTVYSATKAAVRNFARVWTVELKDKGIRVNAISPGGIMTPMFDTQPEAADALRSMFGEITPMGRMGEADEIASMALFLASDDSSYITGTEFFVDGGLAQV